MMTHGWFKGLTLSTHRMRILEETLSFTGNGCQRDGAGIREGSFGMTRQGHETQDLIHHAGRDGNAISGRQQGHGRSRIHHQHPHQHGHNRAGLIGRIEPGAILFGGAKGTRPGFTIIGINIKFTPFTYAGICLGWFASSGSTTFVAIPAVHVRGVGIVGITGHTGVGGRHIIIRIIIFQLFTTRLITFNTTTHRIKGGQGCRLWLCDDTALLQGSNRSTTDGALITTIDTIPTLTLLHHLWMMWIMLSMLIMLLLLLWMKMIIVILGGQDTPTSSRDHGIAILDTSTLSSTLLLLLLLLSE
mmetsp:Transcript_1214/g.1394  ORF Transcript_1214/g.1394 Transcript_1214/m.1394 type:complete len:302 (-) Transcript_1214:441-1346(-)